MLSIQITIVTPEKEHVIFLKTPIDCNMPSKVTQYREDTVGVTLEMTEEESLFIPWSNISSIYKRSNNET